MELEWTREALRFEALAASGEEQIIIEGEAALPGSMRDAVTVLSVQAQAHIREMQAGADEAAVRGKACFQVLYTQGDLTRLRALETTCDFERRFSMPGVSPGMRLEASVEVQETEGRAGSGRITLSALLDVEINAFEAAQRTLITGASASPQLRVKEQTVQLVTCENVGEGKTLVRDEFELAPKLGAGDVLSATGTVSGAEITGGNGRIGVSGVIEARVLHQSEEPGRPLVTTVHEIPYELVIPGQAAEGTNLRAIAEVTDVMADSVLSDKRRVLRVEAEVFVRLVRTACEEKTLIEDLYTLSGPQLDPVTEGLEVHTQEAHANARESTRIQVSLPKDAPPMDTMLAAFAQPVIASVSPAGRRLDAEGLMGVTLIYLPVDSDIPVSVHVREPFAMTFPVEMDGDVTARAYPIECTASAVTSDRAEIRCVLGLSAKRHGTSRVRGVTDVKEGPQEPVEHGFVLVWPPEGESRWETARRLRVAQESLRPAGKHALLAFRK